MPIHSPTGPATAMDTGIRASETKKSRLETRPSRCGGTRRCSRVPQMTIAADPVNPTTKAASPITHSRSVMPINAIGAAPAPHSRIIVVR
jgi:sorbitol-specific phosphotransferase system component IIBC